MLSSSAIAHITTPFLGVSTGLRSFTPLAVSAWFARMGKLPVQDTWASWIGTSASVGLLTAASLGEYIGDKLPSTPNRTAAVPLIGRLILGGLVGALVATAFRRPLPGGIALGALGAAAGTYGGFYARRGLTRKAGLGAIPVAISGDVAAILLAVCSLDRLTA